MPELAGCVLLIMFPLWVPEAQLTMDTHNDRQQAGKRFDQIS